MTDKFTELTRRLVENGHPEDVEQVHDWENEFKKSLLMVNLAKNPAFSMLLDKLRDNIRECNATLAGDREMVETDRKTIFKYRDAWEWFLSIFEDAEKKAKEIEGTVAGHLDELKKSE